MKIIAIQQPSDRTQNRISVNNKIPSISAATSYTHTNPAISSRTSVPPTDLSRQSATLQSRIHRIRPIARHANHVNAEYEISGRNPNHIHDRGTNQQNSIHFHEPPVDFASHRPHTSPSITENIDNISVGCQSSEENQNYRYNEQTNQQSGDHFFEPTINPVSHQSRIVLPIAESENHTNVDHGLIETENSDQINTDTIQSIANEIPRGNVWGLGRLWRDDGIMNNANNSTRAVSGNIRTTDSSFNEGNENNGDQVIDSSNEEIFNDVPTVNTASTITNTTFNLLSSDDDNEPDFLPQRRSRPSIYEYYQIRKSSASSSSCSGDLIHNNTGIIDSEPENERFLDLTSLDDKKKIIISENPSEPISKKRRATEKHNKNQYIEYPSQPTSKKRRATEERNQNQYIEHPSKPASKKRRANEEHNQDQYIEYPAKKKLKISSPVESTIERRVHDATSTRGRTNPKSKKIASTCAIEAKTSERKRDKDDDFDENSEKRPKLNF